MRIVFMGTPEFALPTLAMLHDEYTVCAVVTQPDKPKGRGNQLASSPVKEFAIRHGIPVMQPEKIRTTVFWEELQRFQPDLLVTAAYGKILPEAVLQLPPQGCINVHGSLLPKYRGPAPIHWSIINGETKTGITTMFTDVGLDTGDMLLKKETDISENMTVGELHDRMAQLGADTLRETLIALQNGTLQRIPQPSELATYAPMIVKELGAIDFAKTAREVHNLIRGTNPWPVAYTEFRGQRMKVWKSKLLQEDARASLPGTILHVSDEGMDVACKEGVLRILELQFASGRRMQVGEYICGHQINTGEILG